jgi:hypothetical protein
MAAHEKRFCDQRRRQAPPPSLPRYGTSAHPRVKTRKFVPPVLRHFLVILASDPA